MKKFNVVCIITSLVLLVMAGMPNVGLGAGKGQGQGGCGSANGESFPFASPPTSGLCSPGTASTLVEGTEGWSWTCTGANGKSTLCQAYIAALCGPASGTTCTATAPTTGLCNSGEPSTVTKTATGWEWTCTSPGSSSVTCNATLAACTSASFYYRDTISWTACATGSASAQNSATVIGDIVPVSTNLEGYSCEISFTISGDPFTSAPPFCVATPVTGSFASTYTAYTQFSVATPGPDSAVHGYQVTVVVPTCVSDTCIDTGGVNIICVP